LRRASAASSARCGEGRVDEDLFCDLTSQCNGGSSFDQASLRPRKEGVTEDFILTQTAAVKPMDDCRFQKSLVHRQLPRRRELFPCLSISLFQFFNYGVGSMPGISNPSPAAIVRRERCRTAAAPSGPSKSASQWRPSALFVCGWGWSSLSMFSFYIQKLRFNLLK